MSPAAPPFLGGSAESRPAGDKPPPHRLLRQTPRGRAKPPATSKRKKLGGEILRRLRAAYPSAGCSLDHRTPLELLVATILSAQCTDERVNRVTATLFAKYRDAAAYANAETAELEGDVKSTGFFRAKTRSLVGLGKGLVERFEGRVPARMEDLVTLPGVGRKTANVLLGTVHGVPSIIVDTHVKRVAARLGLTSNDDPEKIEQDLWRVFPERDWTIASQSLILHGRQVCHARKPECGACTLVEICPSREDAPPRRRARPAALDQ